MKEKQAKTSTTLQRSRSTDVLDGHKSDSQGEGSVTLEDGSSEVDFVDDLETSRSGASSKLLTREPRVRSEKPTTKPILLGKYSDTANYLNDDGHCDVVMKGLTVMTMIMTVIMIMMFEV